MKNNLKNQWFFCRNLQVYEWVQWLIVLILLETVACFPALQSYDSQANKAKQSEAKQYVGSINRAQQSKYAENGSFVNSIDALGIGIKTETTNYRYSIEMTKNIAFNYGVAKDKQIKSFVGGVFVIGVKSDNAQNKMRIESILCITDKVGIIYPQPPQNRNGKLVCGTGETQV